MIDFDKFLNKDGKEISETIKSLMPAFAEAISVINSPKPKTISWRKKEIAIAPQTLTKESKKITTDSVSKTSVTKTVEIEYAIKEISDYMVCLVKADGVVGISYCHFDDRQPYFNPEKSLRLAYDRRKIKRNKNIEIFEEYVETEYLYFANSKCPHKVEKVIRNELVAPNNTFIR